MTSPKPLKSIGTNELSERLQQYTDKNLIKGTLVYRDQYQKNPSKEYLKKLYGTALKEVHRRQRNSTNAALKFYPLFGPPPVSPPLPKVALGGKFDNFDNIDPMRLKQLISTMFNNK
jgi:hypothetical protein